MVISHCSTAWNYTSVDVSLCFRFRLWSQHPRPGPFVLGCRFDRYPQLLSSHQWPVWIPHHLARKGHNIHLAILNVRVCLSRISDQSNSPNQEIRIGSLQLGRKWNLAQWRLETEGRGGYP
jgi:hypothetical protein